MSLTIEQVIEKIKARVAAVDPNGPRKFESVVQLIIKSAGKTHHWVGDFKKLQVTEGNAASPDVTLELAEEVFVAVAARTMTMQDALTTGKIQVSGNQQLLAALSEVIFTS